MESEGLLPEAQEGVPMQFVARPGCTPFEYVKFTEEVIEHDIDIVVRPDTICLKRGPPHSLRKQSACPSNSMIEHFSPVA